MVAAIVPFAASGLIVARQVGVGVAVAIILDALIVWPVILPAAAELLGRRGWWPTRPRGAPPAPERTLAGVGGTVAGD
jgi:RND superfamily putative drug exporter